MMRDKLKWASVVLIFMLIVQTIAQPLLPFSSSVSAEESTSRTVTLVGSLQDELGHSTEWDPAAETTQMTAMGNDFYKFEGNLPAGEYEYKVAINGSWDENYGYNGEPGGSNLTLSLEEETTVTFYYHDGTHKITNSKYYNPIPEGKQPRLVGSLQPAIEEGDEWSPATSTAIFHDTNFDGIYEYTTVVPKGNYEYKVALGDNWDEAYPSTNATLNVLNDTEITFYYNSDTKEVSTNYSPEGSDSSVVKDKLFHNTRENAYRQPFGAIPAGEEVTLRLASGKGDLTNATLYLKNYQTGNSYSITMDKKAWTTVDGLGERDFWEGSFTPEEKGVYGYKFIAKDQNATAEYGEDATQGGTGQAFDQNAGLFQLTVFEPGYQTPDWMKEAVVYQIFPDRFYNGDTTNDDNKEYARGTEPIEDRTWEQLPDNPRLEGTENYNGDGIWSNDFFGGDVEGIQDKLDYIESLGVNTLYLNPIAHAASNHKYDATDYKSIDPMFGTPEEFQAFTEELANRDMHLILDGVFNHVGDDSIYFDRYGKYETVGAYEYWSKIYDLMNQEGLSEEEAKTQAREFFEADGQTFSPYGFHNWFAIENEKVNVGTENEHYKYTGWWGFDSLPEIESIPGDTVSYNSELNNEKFANYIMYDEDSASKSWIQKGGSGWRLDVANEVDPEFWRKFREELKATSFAGTGETLKEGEKPLILGEIWDDASKYFLGDQYDSVMNYRFRGAVESFLKNGNASSAEQSLMAVKEDYPSEAYYALMNLMGSHDTPRAIFLLGGGTESAERAEFDSSYSYELGKQRLKLAAIFQMGYPGAPTIYYGDEAGVTGSKDPDDRRTYPWGDEDQELVTHYQNVGEVRTNYADLLAYGDLNHVYADGDVMAYTRTNGEQAGLIVVNRGNSDKTVTIDVKDSLLNGTSLTDALASEYSVEVNEGTVTVDVAQMSGRMLMADTVASKPDPVTNVTASASEGAATLEWDASATEAVEYEVYQTNIKGSFYEKVGTTQETSFTVEGLENGRAYYFAIKAVNEAGNASTAVETKEVVPHYDLSDAWAGSLTDVSDQTLDLATTFDVTGQLYIEGATNQDQAQGVIAKLQVKQSGDENWTDYDATYTGQEGNNNVYKASFSPIEADEYSYRMAFSSDLGASWIYTENTKTFTLSKGEDTTPPADAVQLEQPTKESGQVNLNWSYEQQADDSYMVGIVRDGELVERIKDASKTSFTDYDVVNGETYTYQVKLFDQAGNVVESNKVEVTPDIVMVEVTFKVHAPDYTPLGATVTMPGSLNGWNTGAWEMSRNGAVTPDWEYTTEVQEGTEITYKYVKNGSWDQEGLADHTRADKSDDDISYYGYGAQGTDMKVVVENQGDNKMLVEDEILRWIDMPVVVSSPTDGMETTKEAVTVEGNAIKEGNLTINGESVEVQDDMSFSHEVSLQEGKNTIDIHIEPSEENKTEIFNGDSGAIGKNTKDMQLTVTRIVESTPTEDFLEGDASAAEVANSYVEAVRADEKTPADIREHLVPTFTNDSMKKSDEKKLNVFADQIERELNKMQKHYSKKQQEKFIDKAAKKITHTLEKIKGI